MGHHAAAIAVRVVVRLVVMGAALAGYYAANPLLFPDDGGGANIGAGLIGFAVVMLVSFGWALVDGRRRGTESTVVVWAIVAVVFGLAWLLALALVEADDSMSLAERLRFDAFLAVWTAGMVLVPAGVAAVIGGTAHRTDESARRPPEA